MDNKPRILRDIESSWNGIKNPVLYLTRYEHGSKQAVYQDIAEAKEYAEMLIQSLDKLEREMNTTD